ncbi:unnamed protein product [Euphydryas editha]|uniref:Reverse transcriptase domain-containing protein n=1 Tax=Euphydryas editha TaxID=104508 RepID=A0AAU9TTN7_EUPED|nr:unnamed protein product [Euphydryas editha]
MLVSSVSHVENHGQLPAEGFSYHDLLFLSYKIRPPKEKPTTVMRRNFSNFNNTDFLQDLNELDWDAIYTAETIEEKLRIFNNHLLQLFDTHAPLRPVKLKHLPAPWLTQDIKTLMTRRNAAKSKYKVKPTEKNLLKYKKIRNHCSRVCRDAQREYIQSSLENNNPRQMWKFLKSLGFGRQKGYTSKHIDIDALNKSFSSTTKIDTQAKISTLDYLSSLPVPGHAAFKFENISPVEVKKHINAIKSEAAGSDGISKKMILLSLDFILPVVCHIFNFSLSSCTFPSVWRNALIIPIPKSSPSSSGTNFRPISILPFLSKVFERIVYSQLNLYLCTHNLLSPFQSGFRTGHSTVTALIKILDDVRFAMDNKHVAIVALLDFSNAFNCVDHDLLIAILRTLNIAPCAAQWFQAYLYNRQQCVSFDNKISAYCSLSCGVPQGGVLSPMLFSIFINSISLILTSKHHLYADDLQLYVTTPIDDIGNAITTLNTELNKIVTWCHSYGLLINPSKSQVTIIGNSYQLSKIKSLNLPPILFNSIVLSPLPVVKDLGLLIDNSLTWVPQVAEVSRKVFATISSLKRWKNFLPFKTKLTLANSLLLPLLDYADIVYFDLSEQLLNKLERLQNICIRFIFGLRKFDHVSQHRKQLGWLPIRQRRNMHALSLLYSILYHPHTPPYLKERFTFLGHDTECNLRSRSNNLLVTPLCRSKAYSNSFTTKVIKLWNSLPSDIRQAESLSTFKNRLHKNYHSLTMS